jgi:membrane-associated phospholipid phosphatase
VRHVAVRFLVNLGTMIAVLTAVGMLITSTGAFDGVRDWDRSISVELANSRTNGATDLARFFTRTGDTLPIVVLLAGVTIVLAVLRKWWAMVFLPMAMLAEITTFLSVNHLVGRERPPVDKVGPLPGTFSFPSGHVAATFVCWVGIGLLLAAFGFVRTGRLVAAFGTLLAVGMAWARVYVGMHYTLDVVFGLAMGIAALALSVWVLRVEFDPVARPDMSRRE